MKVYLPKDCGNSPKRILVSKLTEAFAAYDLEKIEPFLDEKVSWQLEGDEPITGKAAFLEALNGMKQNPTKELHISQVLTHGKEAAVRGRMTLSDGSVFSFADFYVFKSAKSELIASIFSFVQQIK
ncbi:nuclear transport factor 2 family protein [Algoriphagus vanfongensis]|uniref:nuclear transport factor 2 family protein n=1 Tax=Algoriphagus vanfongensis TaxID=426371 RepID=UPI000407BEFF|nr:nuclear transport factor 2 family protein [Algoriphagus vanfongensis]